MAIIDCYLKDKLKYQKQKGVDEYGRPTLESPVEIDGRKITKTIYSIDSGERIFKNISIFYLKDKIDVGDTVDGQVINTVSYSEMLGVYIAHA